MLRISTLLSTLFTPSILSAAIFMGGGVGQGITAAGSIVGLSHRTVRGLTLNILNTVFDIVGLSTLVALVAAGLMFILDWGNDQLKERAKKAMLYCIIGLLVLIFGKVIIVFILRLV